jgi:hypothetical protein
MQRVLSVMLCERQDAVGALARKVLSMCLYVERSIQCPKDDLPDTHPSCRNTCTSDILANDRRHPVASCGIPGRHHDFKGPLVMRTSESRDAVAYLSSRGGPIVLRESRRACHRTTALQPIRLRSQKSVEIERTFAHERCVGTSTESRKAAGVPLQLKSSTPQFNLFAPSTKSSSN